MRRQLHWMALAVLVGCSGAAATSDPPPDAGAADNAQDHEPPDGSSPDGGVDARFDAPLDVGRDARGEDAGDGSSIDRDAGRDADANPVDAMPDVVTDSGHPHDAGPPSCEDGAGRCRDFKRKVCTRGNWEWQVGDQQCCVEPGRYAPSGTTVTDSRTGKTWSYGSGKSTGRWIAESSCASRLPGGRLPTTAEIFDLVIGRPQENIAVCSPTIDQVAFPYVYPGPHFASVGECIDMNFGAMVECPATGDSTAYLCVAP